MGESDIVNIFLNIITLVVLVYVVVKAREIEKRNATLAEAVSQAVGATLTQLLRLADASAVHSEVVAKDLSLAHDRADAVSPGSPGEAADASAKSGDGA